MPKNKWLVSVDKVIKVLIEDGYKTVKAPNAETLELNTLRQNFRVAITLARKLGARQNTFSFVLNDYVKRSKCANWLDFIVLTPEPTVILQFALGASWPAIESLAKEFARRGLIGPFIAATRMLRRKPQESEIILLVEDYIKGASQGNDREEKLIELARGVSRDLAERTTEKISARNRRLALHLD